VAVEWSQRLPKRYAEATVASLADNFSALADWDWPQGKGPLIHGPLGIGKSYCAAAIARQKFHAYHVAFVSVTSWLEDRRQSMNGAEIVRPELEKARLVILDDLGRERPSSWTVEQLFKLIDDLYVAEKQLIVTTNKQPLELAGHVGDAGFDRLKELTTCMRVEGESRR